LAMLPAHAGHQFNAFVVFLFLPKRVAHTRS
jgi:hypothetical protein